jgi:hypothetical protein
VTPVNRSWNLRGVPTYGAPKHNRWTFESLIGMWSPNIDSRQTTFVTQYKLLRGEQVLELTSSFYIFLALHSIDFSFFGSKFKILLP